MIGAVNVGDPVANVIFAVTVDSVLPAGVSQLSNVVSIADDGSNGPDLNPNNNNSSDTTPIDATPDLQLLKSDGGVTITPNAVVVYNLTYTNVGTQGATGLVITETVPVDTTFASASSTTGWACFPDNTAGSTCTINIGNVAGGGANGSVNFAVLVNSVINSGVTTITNTASIADDGSNGLDPTPVDNTAGDTTPLNAQPDLIVSKTDNNFAVSPGSTIVYDISYNNIGNQGSTGVILTETVPVNTVFNAAASTAGWSCVPNGNAGSTCTFGIGTVEVGNNGVVQFAVIIDDPLPSGVTTITNTVSIADDGLNGSDLNNSNNSGNESTPLGSALPDLTVSKGDGGITATAGSTVVYAINYANIGNQESTGVVITEVVPTYTIFNQAASTATWTCLPDNNAGSSCTYTIAMLAGGGASGTINFAVDVDASLPTGVDTLSNTVVIADDGNNGTDADPTNNNGADTTPVTAAPDLSIVKTDVSDNVIPGGTVVYNIRYENIGTQDATGVVITETVPTNTNFVSGSSSAGWTCNPDASAGSTCLYNVGNVNVGDAAITIQFAVSVDISLPAGVNTIDNTVVIADDGNNGADTDPSNNDDPETTIVVNALPNLYITKSDGDITSGPGQTIVYTLNYGNIGNQGATGVVINETVPANSTYNAAASSVNWVCTPNIQAGSSCQYAVGGLVINETGSVTFAVIVDDPLAQGVNLIVNTVNIADDGLNGGDSDPSNNSDSDDTSLQLLPPVGLKLGEYDEDDDRIIHWTFWWFNPNNDRDLPAFIFDVMPENTVFEGNASCIADGTSTCMTPIYNAALNRIELNAVIGPDQGAANDSTPNDLTNEIVIRFDTRVISGGSIRNQAFANWDENNDGDANNDSSNGQPPIGTDNPLSPGVVDPTSLYRVYPIPTLSLWALLIMFLTILGAMGIRLRKIKM